ncbi:sensor histidine kinase [Microbacterium sp.]|uniref:sensor histidine kinase n=1 Tax=Microbacterium sp. TaxID=51671 RepID=UPI003A8B1C62
MKKMRWWDVAMGGGLVVATIVSVIDARPHVEWAPVAAVAGLVMLGIAYLVFGRPALRSGQPAAVWPFATAVTVALLIGDIGSPFVALMSAVTYPACWIIARTRRAAILATVAFGTAVIVGTLLCLGLTPPGIITASLSGGLGAVFSVALGLWFRNILDYGAQRDQLVGELTAAQAEVEVLSRERGAADARERIARDLHDTVAQTLAGLVILAERGSRQLADGRTEAASDSMATVESLARDALREARALVAYTAAVSSETAFAESVHRLADRFRVEVGLAVDLHVAADDPIDRETQIVVLRCAQEALANVRKHAGASRVRMSVNTGTDRSARLVVVDDGRGFDPETVHAGFGLEGMRDRVSLAGGSFRVDTDDGRGTTLTVRLPGSAPPPTPASLDDARHREALP